MLSEHETMCCAHCGPSPDGCETLFRIDCDGERMVVLLDPGWSFRFMVIGGPKLDLEVYCPTCTLTTMSTPTINNIAFTEPEPPTAAKSVGEFPVLHCPHCGAVANLHYQGRECTGCDSCCKLDNLVNHTCGCIT